MNEEGSGGFIEIECVRAYPKDLIYGAVCGYFNLNFREIVFAGRITRAMRDKTRI